MTDRLPPGQFATDLWPVMDLGVRPKGRAEDWVFEVRTDADEVLQSFDLKALGAFPRIERKVDLHAASTWSRLGLAVSGHALREVLATCPPPPGTRRLRFVGADGVVSSLPVSALDGEELLLVDRAEQRTLTRAHGGPLRLLAPDRYAVKSIKWLKALIYASEDALDPRERRGVHEDADPWKEQRFA